MNRNNSKSMDSMRAIFPAVALSALGDTSNPARWFGLKISAEAMLGAILLFLLPGTLIARFGFMGMMIGMVLAAVIGDRFGSGKPFAAATIIFLVALAWLSGTTTLVNYAIGACLLTLAIGLGITYAITIVADLDMDGRYVVLSVPAIGIGVMVAPTVGGLLTASQDFSAIFMGGGVTVVLSLLAGLLALHKGLPDLTIG